MTSVAKVDHRGAAATKKREIKVGNLYQKAVKQIIPRQYFADNCSGKYYSPGRMIHVPCRFSQVVSA